MGVYEWLNITRKLGMRKVELNVDPLLIVKILESGVSKDMEGYILVKQIHNLMNMHEIVRVVHLYRSKFIYTHCA